MANKLIAPSEFQQAVNRMASETLDEMGIKDEKQRRGFLELTEKMSAPLAKFAPWASLNQVRDMKECP